MRHLNALKSAAMIRVEATTAKVDCWPVSKTKSLCNTTMPAK
jgi:hypothetical protein